MRVKDQFSKTEILRQEEELMTELITQGWKKDDIKKFMNISERRWTFLFRTIREDVQNMLVMDDGDGQTLDEEIMATYFRKVKQPQVKVWVDKRTGKKYADVTEFFT